MANGLERETLVFSIGGSLICPGETPDLYNHEYIDNLVGFIESWIRPDPKRLFIGITGGGALARIMIDASSTERRPITNWSKDLLGIKATHSNAQVFKSKLETIGFKRLNKAGEEEDLTGEDLVHPFILKHYEEIIRKPKGVQQVICGGGWMPGRSTDYCAVEAAKDYHTDTVINLSNIPQVYDKDPKEFSDARPFSQISWPEYRRLLKSLGMDKWTPGLNAPFDPIASEYAERLGMNVIVVNGHNIPNLESCLKGDSYVGTLIHPVREVKLPLAA